MSIVFKCNSCCIKNIKIYTEHFKADIQLCSAVSKKEVFKNSSHLYITCRNTVTLWHQTICLKVPVVSPSLYSCKRTSAGSRKRTKLSTHDKIASAVVKFAICLPNA